jgi:hypothetical protein
MEQNTLIEKLDGFIRKYYRNKCLRGLLITLGLFAAGALLVSFAEYFAHFDVLGRTVLFYLFAFSVSSVIIGLVVSPLLKLLRLGRVISYEEASSIVGDHFPEIKDKLLNTLQLQAQISSSHAPEEVDLLIASVARRTEQLRPVKFTSAIDLSGNLKYLKYSSVPLVIIAGILLFTPGVISEPAERIIQHRTAFETPAPFRFELISTPLTVPKGEDFEFAVKIIGEVVPSTAYIVGAGGRYRMERLQGDVFRFIFTSVKEDLKFVCSANGWDSPIYSLTTLPVPGVLDYKVVATPPTYTGLDEIVQTNHGDLIIPEGTIITWECRVVDADALNLRFGDSTITPERVLGNLYSATWDARKSTPYWLIPSNKELGPVDSMRFSLGVVSDTRPVIRVVEVEDSLIRSLRYFTGSVGDDYGFTKLRFAVRSATGENTVQYFDLDRPRGKSDDFFYTWNVADLGLSVGESLEYWFEVWDNDHVNGSKSTRSSSKVFSAPTEDELKEERDEASEQIESSIEDAVEQADELRLEIESFKERLREERELDWKDKKALEELLRKQEELRETLEKLNKNNEKKNSRLNEFSPQEERILEKQEELQKLMEDVMSDELKELYERMQELLDDMTPEEIQEHLEKIDVGQDAMEKELDRALEQFKQLEWEVKMEDVISDLERLAEKQAKLAEDAESKEKTQEQLEKEQQELNEEFEQIQKELLELRQQNAELQNPNSMMDSSAEEKSIKESQEKSSSDLEKGKKKKASESQKTAAEEMDALAKRMKSMRSEEEEESLEEDMDALRSLLENIITLSFEEEFLMRDIKTTDSQDPRYVEHGQTQRKLKDDAKMVEDSLYALSMRVRQLAGAVNREIGLVNHHMEKALGGFGNRETPMIAMNQQYVMTSFNNLALLLDETLQEMQNKQECKNPGTGNCNKPGGSGKKPSAKAGDLKKMQQALGKQLEEMKSKMGEGANKGESNQRGGQMSQQLAEMAAQQAALRELAKQRANELNGDGSGDGAEMKRIAEEMEQLERDLVNRNVDVGTLDRQREIITRLLEAEEAERVRGEKDERRSVVGNQGLHPETPQGIDYLKDRANEIELLKTIPVDLSPFYRDRVDEYFNTITP